MQFSIFFATFILQFCNAFASPTNGWQPINEEGPNDEKGYECGNDIFSDSEIKEALSMYHQYVNKNLHSPLAYHAPQEYSSVQQYPNIQQYPNVPQEHTISQGFEDLDILQNLDFQELNFEEFDFPLENNFDQEHQNIQQYFTPKPYHGPLYSDSGSSNYILWPIKKEKIIHSSTKYSSDPYHIVIKENDGKVIDVISKIINNHYTKCIRIDGSRTDLSTSAPELNNGYQCAHEFLSDNLIQQSLHLVWDKIGSNIKYPVPYVGRLYAADSGYKIWPIFSNGDHYRSVEVGPYFLIIDRQGQLIETVVEGLSNNFLRCTRSRKFSKEPSSNAPKSSSKPVPSLQSGYYCGRVFFNDNAVKEAAKAAKIAEEKYSYKRLPAKYNGPPFYKPVLFWPLMHDGQLYKTGALGQYRVVLTLDFKITGVAIVEQKTVIKKVLLCEKGMMKEEKDHEKSDYLCRDHVVTNRNLEKAAKVGCSKISNGRKRVYPARYQGPNFDKSGPYLTYPVLKDAEFVTKAGPDRVVMNSNCEVVGAITTFSGQGAKNPGKRFVLCVKLHESSMKKTYIEPDVPITEHLERY